MGYLIALLISLGLTFSTAQYDGGTTGKGGKGGKDIHTEKIINGDVDGM